jgi:hypothetical protein
MTIFWYSLRNLKPLCKSLWCSIGSIIITYHVSVSMLIFIFWWIWHYVYWWGNIIFILNENMTQCCIQIDQNIHHAFLVQWNFLPLDFNYYSWSLWTLFLCFSISSCVALMCSIASTSTLLLLYYTSRIREITFVLLCLTLVLLGAIGVIGCFPNANVDG